MLHDDDKMASKAVDEKPFALRPAKIPTDDEMQQLKEHIKKMKVCCVIIDLFHARFKICIFFVICKLLQKSPTFFNIRI